MGYVDSSLDADFNGALRDLEGLGGERIVIQGKPYPATFGKEVTGQDFSQGPPREVVSVVATVRRNLFPVAPVIGNLPVTARGRTWRIVQVSPAFSTYELTLESDKK